jgi:stage II sporulation protein D
LLAPGWTAVDAADRSTPADDCRAILSGPNLGLTCGERALREPPFRLAPGATGPAAAPLLLIFGAEQRRCPGRLRLELADGRLRPILTLDLEDYVAGVLAAEAPDDQPEYLKAMAVCIRSHARQSLRRSAAPVADDTRSQLYRGAPDGPRAPALAAAVQATAGQVLRLSEEPAPAFFHACCGGRTQPAERTWPRLGDLAHLRGVADVDERGRPWCAGDRWFAWTRTIAAERWRSFLAERFRASSAQRPSDDGRVSLQSESGSRTIGAWPFRVALGRTLGWNAAPSDRFTIEAGEAEVALHGRGFGHRVGLCQAGALAQAKAGRSFADILRFYFPGAEVR